MTSLLKVLLLSLPLHVLLDGENLRRTSVQLIESSVNYPKFRQKMRIFRDNVVKLLQNMY